MIPDSIPQLWRVSGLPSWLGPTLLVLAILITAAGPHGLRLMNAALLGGGAFCAAFFGLRGGELHDWVHGAVAIPLAMIGFLLGLLQPAAGTGLVAAALGAGAGLAAARFFKLSIVWAPPAAGAFAGFWWGFTQHKQVALWLPPVFAALFALAGAQLTWRIYYPPLFQLVAPPILAALLIGLALVRAHRVRTLEALNAKRASDEELKRRIAEQTAEFRRIYGQQD